MFKRVHHVHYVVEDRAAIMEYLDRNFGMKPAEVIDYKSGRQRDVIYEVGGTYLQITEPIDPTCTSGKFLAKHGPGVLHVAWAVDGIEALARKLVANGNKLKGKQAVSASPHGYLTLNIDQSTSHGVWFQLAQDQPQDGAKR